MGSTSAGTVRYGLLGVVPNPRTAAGILVGLCYTRYCTAVQYRMLGLVPMQPPPPHVRTLL